MATKKTSTLFAEPGGAALYHRVSTLDQDPKLARRELPDAAAAPGLRVGLDVEETGSGARNDRPGLQRVLEAARRGHVTAVLVWKLDRFGRSALDVLANIKALTDTGVRFIAVSQGIDVKPDGDAISRLTLTVLAGVAEFERELIRERTKLGMAAAKAAGKKLGRPRLEDRPKTARRAPDVKAIVRGRRKGASWAELADLLGAKPTTLRRRYVEADGKAA